MQDSAKVREKVSQLLLLRYIDLNPEFRKDQCDYEMLDTFYNIIGDSELGIIYNSLDSYIQNHHAILREVIVVNSGEFIFNQPAYLFIYYSLWFSCNKIINEWPYDYESLTSVIRWSGYSINLLFDA